MITVSNSSVQKLQAKNIVYYKFKYRSPFSAIFF